MNIKEELERTKRTQKRGRKREIETRRRDEPNVRKRRFAQKQQREGKVERRVIVLLQELKTKMTSKDVKPRIFIAGQPSLPSCNLGCQTTATELDVKSFRHCNA